MDLPGIEFRSDCVVRCQAEEGITIWNHDTNWRILSTFTVPVEGDRKH
jgi:hypothetical protein